MEVAQGGRKITQQGLNYLKQLDGLCPQNDQKELTALADGVTILG
jgi:hypothetical protein